jgi:hypothetical protein
MAAAVTLVGALSAARPMPIDDLTYPCTEEQIETALNYALEADGVCDQDVGSGNWQCAEVSDCESYANGGGATAFNVDCYASCDDWTCYWDYDLQEWVDCDV